MSVAFFLAVARLSTNPDERAQAHFKVEHRRRAEVRTLFCFLWIISSLRLVMWSLLRLARRILGDDQIRASSFP